MYLLRWAVAALLGPWTFVAAAGVALGIAVMRGAPYLGEGMWTVRWAANGLWLLWTVVAAAAAVDAARLSRSGSRHLALLGRGIGVHGRVVGVTGICAAAGHVVVVAAMLLVGGVSAPRVGWGPVLLAVGAQAVTIVWFAAVGSALGRYLPPVVAGIAASLAAFVAGFLLIGGSTGEPGYQVLGDSGATVSQIGVSWNVQHLMIQVVTLGVSALLLALPRPRLRAGLLVPSPRGAAAAVCAVLVLAAAPHVATGTPLLAQPEPPDVCVGAHPEFCFYEEHQRYAPETDAAIRTLVDAAVVGSYPAFVPDRVEERSRRYDGADGQGTVSVGILTGEPVDPVAVAMQMLEPNWCPQLYAAEPPPEDYFRTLTEMTETWARLIGSTYDPTLEGWSSLRPEQVAAVQEAWSACDLGFRP